MDNGQGKGIRMERAKIAKPTPRAEEQPAEAATAEEQFAEEQPGARKRHYKYGKRYMVLACALILAISGVVVFAIYNFKTLKSVENNFTPAEITIAVQERETADNTDQMTTNNLTWKADASSGTTVETYSAYKEVWIANLDVEGENNTDAYIRACIVPRFVRTVTYPDGSTEEIDLSAGTGFGGMEAMTGLKVVKGEGGANDTIAMGDVTFVLADNWDANWFFNPTDGYFYHKNIVPFGGVTASLIERVRIPADVYEQLQQSATDADTVTSSGVTIQIDILADAIQTGGGSIDYRWKAAGVTIDENQMLEPVETTSE